mmetsp:Transcript_145301/g.404989  ORF Transcript_145301/g.404989 Transcript_145301/m.404989 type:complete len:565 (-) Transcript_145301:93-1787(-)
MMQHLRALTLAAGAALAVGADCGGKAAVGGLAGPAAWKGGGLNITGAKVEVSHNAGVSLVSSDNACEDWNPDGFKVLHLLGKTVSYKLDLSKVGCGCNVALYLIEYPAKDWSGNPSKGSCDYSPYYCDANQVCGQWCPEIDIMEANNHAFQSTPHKCDAPTKEGHYSNCDRNGCAQNTRTMGNAYGPGGGFTIDTTRPFNVSTAFNAQGWTLTGMVTTLRQEGRQVVMDHAACDPGYLAQAGSAIQKGMSLRITYWGDTAETMNWMDVPPCGPEACEGANGGPGTISHIVIDPPEEPLVATTTPAPATTAMPLFPVVPTLAPVTTALAVTTPAPAPAPAQPVPGQVCAKAWTQCGGNGYTGPTCCTSDSHCVRYNDWYSQCVAKPMPAPRPTPPPTTPAPTPAPTPPPPAARARGAPEEEHVRVRKLAVSCAGNTLKLGLACAGLYLLAVLLAWLFPGFVPAAQDDLLCEWVAMIPVQPGCLTRTLSAPFRACGYESAEGVCHARVQEVGKAAQSVNRAIYSSAKRCDDVVREACCGAWTQSSSAGDVASPRPLDSQRRRIVRR